MPHTIPPRLDSDIKKGAFETEEPSNGRASGETNTSMAGQMGHRNQPEEAQGEDYLSRFMTSSSTSFFGRTRSCASCPSGSSTRFSISVKLGLSVST